MKDLFKPLSLAALCFLGAMASAADLYLPTRPAADQGITFKSWGSGTIAETTEAAFDGTSSIRIASRNFFQGGLLTYAAPVDLSTDFADRNNLLRLMVLIPGSSGSGASGTGAIKTLRLVIGTSDGKRSEAYVDLSTTSADSRGWRGIGIPLQVIRGFGDTNKMVTSVGVSADTVGTVYLGEIRTFNDTTPVYGETGVSELNLAIGDEYTFTANGTGGATPLKFTWDFDHSDGSTTDVDAEGQTIKRRFRKAGEYTITLTVVDIYGLKKPHTSTVRVTVNP